MKFPSWPRYYAIRAASGISKAAAVLLAPIGFREVLLLGGSVLLGVGAATVYPPAAYLVPGSVLVGVAIFGVRA